MEKPRDCGHIPNGSGFPLCGKKNHTCWPMWDPWGIGSYCKEVRVATCKKCLKIKRELEMQQSKNKEITKRGDKNT